MDPMDKTNHSLQIGQSLTPEQVRNLPDGAVAEVFMENQSDRFTISDYAKTCTTALMAHSDFRKVVLVSLPSEPSPGDVIPLSPEEYRRRIEPQAEPAPRVASPVAQRAARNLVDTILAGICGTALPIDTDAYYQEVANLCRDYLDALDHARSIGAI